LEKDNYLLVVLRSGMILLFLALTLITIFRFFVLQEHFNLSPSQKALLKEKNQIVIACNLQGPPLAYRDDEGRMTGFIVELLKSAGRELGVKVKFVPMPWGQAFVALEKGQIDGVEGINYDDALNYNCQLSRPYLLDSLNIFLLKKEKRINRFSELVGKKVAVINKDYNILHLNKKKGIEFIIVTDYQKAINLLLAGQVQAYIGSRLASMAYLEKIHQETTIKMVPEKLRVVSYCIAVKKGNKDLAALLDSGFFYLEQKGIKREIEGNWLKDLMPEKNPFFFFYLRDFFNIFVFFLLFASVFLYYWTHYLQKQVDRKNQQLIESNRKLMLLNTISSILNQSLELEKVLSKALAQLVNSLGLLGGAVSWQDKVMPSLIVATAEGVSVGSLDKHEFWRQKLWSGEREENDNYCYLNFPLQSKEKNLGVMGFAAIDKNTFHQDNVKLLGNVANQFAIALENSQLYLKACRRMMEINTIREIGNELAVITDLELLAEKTVRILHSAFHYQFCSLFLLDEEKKRISYYAYSGTLPDENKEGELDISQGILRQVINSGEPVRLGDRQLVVPLKFQKQIIGLINAMYNGEGLLSEDDYFILTTLAQDIAVAIKNAQFSKTLRSLSFIDGLTGIANRRCFEENLAAEWQKAQDKSFPLSLILFDVDFFKLYNDNYGHLAGDSCLKQVARTLKNGLQRSQDLLCRYGGEEFVVLLPATPLEQGVRIAKKLRKEIESLRIPHGESPLKQVTVSAGIASTKFDSDLQVNSLITWADQALYKAKSQGRNRVEIYSKNKVVNK